jgi:hypothetical protein
MAKGQAYRVSAVWAASEFVENFKGLRWGRPRAYNRPNQRRQRQDKNVSSYAAQAGRVGQPV